MKHHPHNCPAAQAQSLRLLGCGCDGAFDDGCPMCTNNYHTLFCPECTWEELEYSPEELLCAAIMALDACSKFIGRDTRTQVNEAYDYQEHLAKEFNAEPWELESLLKLRNAALDRCLSVNAENLLAELLEMCLATQVERLT